MWTTRNSESSVNQFEKIIKKDIVLFDKQFNNVLSKKASTLYSITKYISQSSGKKIRPICTILASGLCNKITEKTNRAAILIELLHTATLVHDDIVDDAQLRRGLLSINSIWKNKIAVLTGDYFLAKGLHLAVSNQDYDILSLISETVQRIVEGELMQIEKTKQLNLTEKDYYEIISLKTATLFQCAFESGGISAFADKITLEKLKKLGLIIGILFQIRDDVLDYSDSTISGKKQGNDIQEGKINLPLLYSISNMTFFEKNQVFRILRKKRNSKKEIDLVVEIVKKYKGIDTAMHDMQKYYKQALSILQSFQSNRYKESMILLLNFLIERNK